MREGPAGAVEPAEPNSRFGSHACPNRRALLPRRALGDSKVRTSFAPVCGGAGALLLLLRACVGGWVFGRMDGAGRIGRGGRGGEREALPLPIHWGHRPMKHGVS